MMHLFGSPLEGSLLTLATNIRLGWKILPRTNTPAYLKYLLITAVKCFISSAPRVYVFKLFSSSHAVQQNKLECLSVPSVFLIKWSLLGQSMLLPTYRPYPKMLELPGKNLPVLNTTAY